MNIAVRYQSRGGNTKTVAEAVAKAAAARAESIDVPLSGPVDLLFIGGGVYGFDMDKSLKEFLKGVTPDTAKSIAVFSTGGSMSITKKIAAALKENGVTPCEKTLSLRMHVRNCKFLGGKGSVKLSKKELGMIDDYVKAAV